MKSVKKLLLSFVFVPLVCLCVSLTPFLCSCGQNANPSRENIESIESIQDITQSEDASQDIIQSEDSSQEEVVIDVDLTILSSTLVYAEVYNMMLSPDKYIGKTVKMEGTFAVYYNSGTSTFYFACLIADATGCCAQGIEFVLEGDFVFPNDYPDIGVNICVMGVFDTYQEGQYTYCTLRNAKFA